MEKEEWKEHFKARGEQHLKLDALADQYVKIRDSLPEFITRDAFLEMEGIRLEMEQGYRALHELEMLGVIALVENLSEQLENYLETP